MCWNSQLVTDLLDYDHKLFDKILFIMPVGNLENRWELDLGPSQPGIGWGLIWEIGAN